MLVERHFSSGNAEIVRLCSESKELYNKCNFYMRKAWFDKERLPDINILVKLVQNETSFKNLHNTKTAKQTIRKVLTDWSNFRKALNSYRKNPKDFKREPKPPNYKEKLAQVIFYSETIKRKPLKSGLIVPTNECFSIKSNKKFDQVVITPQTFGFVIEVQYESEQPKGEKVEKGEKLNKKNVCSIDIGVNNLCTITSNQHDPLLVNGRIVKSLNQHYNKHPNKQNSKKRYWRIENYFHHVSKMIIQNCIKHDIGTIIIGKNDGWKQDVKMRKKEKQNFQYIPFFKLIQKIQYKADIVGIDVKFTEESYTSKASFKDRDSLDGSLITGIRSSRGMYKNADGSKVNADVNGSLNICRKVIQDSEFLGRLDRSLAARPVKVNPLRRFAFQTIKV